MKPIGVILIILLYFLVLLIISYFTGRKTDSAGFFIGNRQSPWYVVAFGMVGASLSGVTFISVPGWVGDSQMSYMQMVLGYLAGYAVIAEVLMPLYYRLKLTSIYTYLQGRFGFWSYKTGASFFLLSRIIGASFRLFLVANVLHISVFGQWGIPFSVTVTVTILFIWLYTFRGGIRTIIWTDTLQTLLMLTAVGFSVYYISRALNLDVEGIFRTVKQNDLSQVFFFGDWNDERHFLKQFLSGAFITIVMTGLDQDMMQKNLSCRNIREAKKNMYWFSMILVPVNLLFLSLGVLIYSYAAQTGMDLPAHPDDLFPLVALQQGLGPALAVLFILGLIAAAYSSADSALTALTTSFTVDILNPGDIPENRMRRLRTRVHIGISFVLFVVIMIFRLVNDQSVISALFTAAGYTYGPILGLYAYGLLTRREVHDRWVPVVALLSPVLCGVLSAFSEEWFRGYRFGFEILIVNGFISFLGLWLISLKPRTQ
ncbi:MAG TPA: sodium:solute symporter [Bacteroidetes bacterium]|nr:sodium:solute symporter [Bacteroidota bacterium]